MVKSSSKVLVFFHGDMDGISSAAIVKRVYPEAKCISVKYGDTPYSLGFSKTEIEQARIIVLDFAFSKEAMEDLTESELIWIDHHKSAMEAMPELWENEETEESLPITGKRHIDKAACQLTWEYFFPDKPVPECIELIADWDMWKFARGEYTKRFHEAAYLYLQDPEDKRWTNLLGGKGVRTLRSFLSHGAILLEAKRQRVKKTFENGEDGPFYGYRARVCNSNVDISDLGNYAVEQGYDIGIVWGYVDGIIKVSLRSKGDVDVSKLAEKFKGGGHKNAAGFSVDWKEFDFLVRPHILG